MRAPAIIHPLSVCFCFVHAHLNRFLAIIALWLFMCIFLATNKTRHLSMSHQLIFSCKISVWSFLILMQYVCIVAHGGCRCCCYYLAPQTMHFVNVFCQPVDSLCNVTQSGLSFSLLVKFVYFVHILRVHLKVSLPQVRSHVCLSHAVWIRVYLS